MLVKAMLIPEGAIPLLVQFNPKELSVSKTINWSPQRSSGANSEEQQFTSGQGRQLSFELFFDRYELNIPVLLDTMILEKMTQIVDEKHGPPVVKFIWGAFWFTGVFTQLNIRYTMFLNLGLPCRATAQCSMREYTPLDQQRLATPPQSPDHAKMRVVRRGETLHSIAAMEYDTASEWRRIADANKILDPLNLEPGMELLVPPILPT